MRLLRSRASPPFGHAVTVPAEPAARGKHVRLRLHRVKGCVRPRARRVAPTGTAPAKAPARPRLGHRDPRHLGSNYPSQRMPAGGTDAVAPLLAAAGSRPKRAQAWPSMQATCSHPRTARGSLPSRPRAPRDDRSVGRRFRLLDPGEVLSPRRLPRRRADRPVEDRRARPAIPRSRSFSHTCVSPRYLNVPRTACRSDTGGEACQCEEMDPSHIDIDGFWLKDADAKGKEIAPIAKH